MTQPFGPVQLAILSHMTPVALGSTIYDLRVTRKTVLVDHQASVVSHAVHQLIRRGILEPMTRLGKNEYAPDRGSEVNVRYVRRCAD